MITTKGSLRGKVVRAPNNEKFSKQLSEIKRQKFLCIFIIKGIIRHFRKVHMSIFLPSSELGVLFAIRMVKLF